MSRVVLLDAVDAMPKEQAWTPALYPGLLGRYQAKGTAGFS
jgi:hypothetical protein